MEIQTLIQTLQSFGLQGLIATAFILLVVFAAKKGGLVATGDQARIANVILAAILYGLNSNPQSEAALQAALSSVLAALVYTFLERLGKRTNPAG